MKLYLFLPLFFVTYIPLSSAQDEAGGLSEKLGQSRLQDDFILRKLQEDSFFLRESIVSPEEFLPAVLYAIRRNAWSAPESPGPLFNSCFATLLSIKCHYMYLRISRLSDNGAIQEPARSLSQNLRADYFREEIQRMRAMPTPYGMGEQVWMLLLAVEFHDWAVERGVSDPTRLFPPADELAGNLLDTYKAHPDFLNFPGIAGLLYSLHRYFQTRGFEEKTAQVETFIKSFFQHRNDGGPEDTKSMKVFCERVKLSGAHRDWLTENDLIFSPEYEEFEERTAVEDTDRWETCKSRYRSTTRLSEMTPSGQNERALRSFYFYHQSIVFLLYKVFGEDAVRYFLRHNPALYSLPVPAFQLSGEWLEVYWWDVRAFSVLRDVAEDIEEQVEWQARIDAYKKELADNLLSLVRDEDLFSISAIYQFIILSLLEPDPPLREGRNPLP